MELEPRQGLLQQTVPNTRSQGGRGQDVLCAKQDTSTFKCRARRRGSHSQQRQKHAANWFSSPNAWGWIHGLPLGNRLATLGAAPTCCPGGVCVFRHK